MSDYLFLLENHLDAAHNRAVEAMQAAATGAGTNVWLTGGAMRDMLRGAPIRDLDFTVERGAVALGKSLPGATVLSEDAAGDSVELVVEEGVRVSVANVRTESGMIHDDLQRRDFTINAIALSLNRGSKGLLIDPTNGQADIVNKELRTAYSYAFLDDATRLMRMVRFQYGMGFQPVPRTLTQFENATIDELEKTIPLAVIAAEVKRATGAENVGPVLDGLAEAGILQTLSPSLAGEKRNTEGLAKLEKIAESVLPPEQRNTWLAFLAVMTEKLSVRERADAVKAFGLSKTDAERFKHLDEGVKTLEAALKSASVKKPSHVYDILEPSAVDEVLLLLHRSSQRVVQDRVRMYFEKYRYEAQEVTEEEILATGVKAGTPKYDKARKTLIAQRLNMKPKVETEPEEVVEETPEAVPMVGPSGRGARAK